MLMSPEKQRVKEEPENIPPPGDPYEMMYRQYIWLIRRLYIVEQKMATLEKTWVEILNVSKNSALPPLDYNPWQQPQHQQPPQSATPLVIAEQTFAKSTPVWEQTGQSHGQEEKIEKPKGKSSNGTIVALIILGVLILAGIILAILREQGWSCALPIPGVK
jgi:hypothetical protein